MIAELLGSLTAIVILLYGMPGAYLSHKEFWIIVAMLFIIIQLKK